MPCIAARRLTPGTGREGGGGFDAAARRRIEETLRRGDDLRCPDCDTLLVGRRLDAPPGVSYVRHRILIICPACHRSGGFDART
jgi:hypothetical protein